MLRTIAASSALAAAVSAAGPVPYQGVVVSAQFYCDAVPCTQTWKFGLSRTTPMLTAGETNDVFLQTYVAQTTSNGFQAVTAYDDSSRVFTTAAMLKNGYITFWQSTISADANSATPIYTAVEVAVPMNDAAPFPMNVLPLELKRVLSTPQGLLAVFSNGQMFSVDLGSASAKLLAKVIPDERLLDTDHPSLTMAATFDSATGNIFTVAAAGSNAFVVPVNPATGSVGAWLQLTPPQGDNSGFSPETWINAHMIDVATDGSRRLMLTSESLPSVGFDQMNFVDMETGALDGFVFNLMEENCLLACSTYTDCDMGQVSAFDPVSQTLFFQGHLVSDETQPLQGMWAMSLNSNSKDPLYPVVWNMAPPGQYGGGYVGYQWVSTQ